MDADKRAAPRFLYSEPVTYSLPELTVNGGIAGNISLSGMSLKVQEFVPMGVLLELQLHFGQNAKVVWVKAHVVWVRELFSEECFEIGLRFIESEECAKAIGEYINTCRAKLTPSSKESNNHG